MKMDNENYKQIMFAKSEGFWQIVYDLQAKIAYFWTMGDLTTSYANIKHLYAFVCAHFKDKGAKTYFLGNKEKNIKGKFNEIEELLYNPNNQKYDTYSKARKLKNFKEADNMMFDVYIEVKKHMKNSDMELYYGTPKDIINELRKGDNIKKVFGKDKR